MFSRHLETYPLRSISAQAIIGKLKEYFANFGLCELIVSDNGTQFRCDEVHSFLKDLNIEIRHSSVYHPQTSGIIEASHNITKQSLACLCNESFNWHENIQTFKLFYNNSIHSATGQKPSLLFFLRDLRTPLSIQKAIEDTDIQTKVVLQDTTQEDRDKFLRDHLQSLTKITNATLKQQYKAHRSRA